MKTFDIRETIEAKLFIKSIFLKQKYIKDIDFILNDSGIRYGSPAYGFESVRVALYFILSGGVKRQFKRIFIPAYICPVIADIAVKSNIKPVLIDVDPESFNIDPEFLKKIKFSNSDALLINHTFGNPVDMDFFDNLPLSEKPYIISDNALALFSKFNNRDAGFGADAILLNLHKQIPNTEGALVINSDLEIQKYEKLKESTPDFNSHIGLFFQIKGYPQRVINYVRKHRALPSYNKSLIQDNPSKISSLSKKMFQNQLGLIKKEIDKRRIIAKKYDSFFPSKYFTAQKIQTPGLCSYPNYSISLKSDYHHLRDQILSTLRKRGIFADRMWYDAPVSHEYSDFFYDKVDNAALLSKSVINLPIKGDYSHKDIEQLFFVLNSILKKY